MTGVRLCPLSRLFVCEPNGIQLEHNFHSASETGPGPDVANDQKRGVNWFEPGAYAHFGGGGPMNDHRLLGCLGCGSAIFEIAFALAGIPHDYEEVDYEEGSALTATG